jgi:hypothetical protein
MARSARLSRYTLIRFCGNLYSLIATTLYNGKDGKCCPVCVLGFQRREVVVVGRLESVFISLQAGYFNNLMNVILLFIPNLDL